MNQRDQIEDNKQTESLTDLPVDGEPAEETKGGAGSGFSSASMQVLLGDASAR